MTSKLILTLLCLVLICTNMVYSQDISFDYDDSGNCTLKYKTVVLARAQSNQNNEQFYNKSDSIQSQLSKIGDHNITIYPNPTKGLITISLSGNQIETKVEFRLTDLSGRLLKNGQFEYMLLKLDMSQFIPGTYLLHIYMNNKKDVWKIIKE